MQTKLWMPILALAIAGLACAPSSLLGDGSLLKDDFSSESSGWGTGTDDTSAVEYDNGQFMFKMFTESYFVWSTSSKDDLANLHLEVTAENVSDQETTSFGVMCYVNTTLETYYYMLIASDGFYAILHKPLVGDREILTKDFSDDIKKGADSYLIGADCSDKALTLYVDGTKIDSVELDTAPSPGAVGLFVLTGEDEKEAEVRFDNLVVTELKKAEEAK